MIVLYIFAVALGASLLGFHSGRVAERLKAEDLRLTGGDPKVHVFHGQDITIGPGETLIIPGEKK